MRIRLLVNDQFGDFGPRAGDTGITFQKMYDEGEEWYAVFFDAYGTEEYFVVRNDMVEEIE